MLEVVVTLVVIPAELDDVHWLLEELDDDGVVLNVLLEVGEFEDVELGFGEDVGV